MSRGRPPGKIEFLGESRTINEWAALFDIDADILRQRLKRDWSLKDALDTPVGRENVPKPAPPPRFSPLARQSLGKRRRVRPMRDLETSPFFMAMNNQLSADEYLAMTSRQDKDK